MKLNNIQSKSKLTEDGSITNTVLLQPNMKWIWTAEINSPNFISLFIYLSTIFFHVLRDFARFPVFTFGT